MEKDHHVVWKNCLNHIQKKISPSDFEKWFKPILPVSLEHTRLTIQVPTLFFIEILDNNFSLPLTEALVQELGSSARMSYQVPVDPGSGKNPALGMVLQSSPQATVVPQEGTKKIKPLIVPPQEQEYVDASMLTPSFTFSSFIVGSCNQLAHALALRISETPGENSFNPLLIFGNVGLGKTHLAQAIGNRIKEKMPNKRIAYVPMQTFIDQFVESIQKDQSKSFKSFYSKLDVLIVDDIQFLDGKEKTQETFFTFFNQMKQNNKQIILTSDRPPKDLEHLKLNDRLTSRFKSGQVADMQMPDYETRMAIIQQKTQREGVYMPTDVMDYIARNADTNIRELEGILLSIIAQHTFNKEDLNIKLAEKVIKNIINRELGELSIDKIQRTVSEYFNVSVQDLIDKTRKKEIALARQVAMYFCKEFFAEMSLKSIGEKFGKRDHSTVIHAIQTVNDQLDVDSNFKAQIEEIRKKLK